MTFSQVYKESEPFAYTFSIVARDSVTGDIGVAIQSHWFSVGSVVPYGKTEELYLSAQKLFPDSLEIQ